MYSGLEIWCIENLQLVPVPKSSHGKFYTGSAYIILNVSFAGFNPISFQIIKPWADFRKLTLHWISWCLF